MNSRIILCKGIKLDRDYANVLSYSQNDMLSLCRNSKHRIIEASDYSFVTGRENTIRTDFTYEQCLKANYIAFQNPRYDNKWFFAFIDNIRYLSDRVTEISFTVDAWSTWFDDWDKKRCFIVREHVDTDNVGANTVPENLEIGDLICDFEQYETDVSSVNGWYWIVISTSYNPTQDYKSKGVGMYAGYIQGSMWFAWLINPLADETETIDKINTFIQDTDSQGMSDSITSIFTLPYQAIPITGTTNDGRVIEANYVDEDVTFTKSSFRAFDDFTPKNNKMYTYPYSFCRVSNNNGQINDYKIELFDDEIDFNITGIPCEGYSSILRPKNYKGQSICNDETISLGKYPTLSWASDSFTNWVSQNAVNIVASNAVSGLGLIASAATGNVAGTVLSASSMAANLIGQFNQASLLNNNAKGNLNSGDIAFKNNMNRFKFMHMRPKKEYLQIIDDYFTRFGYKINRVLEPNIVGRANWNYLEIGGNETVGNGDVPVTYMNQINDACRRGVTIWHNHENIGNFNLDNSIV